MKPVTLRIAALAAMLLFTTNTAFAAALGTAITYQGRLDRNNAAVSDTYSFILKLYDAPSAGTQIGTTQTVNGVLATNGLFSLTVDFGAGAFSNQARWMDIQVKGSGDAAYTPFTLRQPITAVPVALYAINGGSGTSQWITDASGIDFLGNVGIGDVASAGIKFYVNAGTTTLNPAYFTNNQATTATMVLRNFGANGYGLYDDQSARTYFKNKVGIGNSNPTARLDVVTNTGPAIMGTVTGSSFAGTNAAIYAQGNTGGVLDPTPAMGVYARSTDDRAVAGFSTNYWGVSGDCTAAGTYGILGTPSEGVFGFSPSFTKPAGRFSNAVAGGIGIEGNGIAKVKTLQITGGADLAERFESATDAEPGTVMAIDPATAGHIRVASEAYCRTVAGVVSGANGLNAGVELAKDEQKSGTVALALTGRVWVKCDASHAPIRAGDLLTSAARAGHAMRADDRDRSQGAILGKAMTSLEHGTGLVLVLVSLQ